jgi:hypothetical protein
MKKRPLSIKAFFDSFEVKKGFYTEGSFFFETQSKIMNEPNLKRGKIQVNASFETLFS